MESPGQIEYDDGTLRYIECFFLNYVLQFPPVIFSHNKSRYQFIGDKCE